MTYNDKWDEDPNDPDLGQLVPLEDGSRHTKWMKAMMPRLEMMKAMLKASGVIAICIDDNELFHLGMMMDEVFGEDNRLGIISWQKAHAPKNDSKHISTATEYVLVYAKDKEFARTHLLPRDEEMNRSFGNPDNDPQGEWVAKDPTAREHRENTAYAIQSPFTGYLHYPNGEYRFQGELPEARAHWSGLTKKEVKAYLEEWGVKYVAPMELCIDDMLDEMGKASKAARSLGLSFEPKAIYVSTTNAVDGFSAKDDAMRPFKDRQARPILIWRHLVESRKVDPSTIAVYCDLKFDKKSPPPDGFNLFAGGDADYQRFIAGGFRHVIFNLSLQEGWDDPSCCFAYIDKDMGSPDQVTQVVGRVLRQPGAKHYPANALNTAHFYIRTDEKGVFEAIIEDVRKKIASELPDVTLTVRGPSGKTVRPALPPKKELTVPSVSIDSTQAQIAIAKVTDGILDFTQDKKNTIGTGARIQVLQTIGSGEEEVDEWVDVAHSNPVTARWIFAREVQRRRPKALHLCDIEGPLFDVMVEYHSPAADHFRQRANAVVDAYIEHSRIVQNAQDHPYIVGPIPVTEAKLTKFKNALHEGYSDLNQLELAFAVALDKSRKVWCRNPASGGFAIDLLDSGRTRQFKPDFLVWSGRLVVAIDTKGDHLIVEDASRKLFDIPKMERGVELVVRLVTAGEWHLNAGVPEKKHGTAAFTVWKFKQGKLSPRRCVDAAAAIGECLSA